MNTPIPITESDAATARRYGAVIEALSPRRLKVTGPNGEAEIRRGAGDGQLRLFTGGQCHGVMSENYVFEEALDLVSHAFSQERFRQQAAVAQEGETE
jgi:hypothetical protein